MKTDILNLICAGTVAFAAIPLNAQTPPSKITVDWNAISKASHQGQSGWVRVNSPFPARGEEGGLSERVNKKFFEKHPVTQAVGKINGKSIVVVPISLSGSRVTGNVNFDPAWRSDVNVHIYLATYPGGRVPRAFSFQQKYDESWGEDPNVGPVIAPGQAVNFHPGHDRYFAKRNGPVDPGYIVVVEDGLSSSDINSGLVGIRFE